METCQLSFLFIQRATKFCRKSAFSCLAPTAESAAPGGANSDSHPSVEGAAWAGGGLHVPGGFQEEAGVDGRLGQARLD